MPRGRSNKNRRGGGRTDSVGSVKEDIVVEIDLDSDNMSLDSSNMNVDSSNLNVDRIDVDKDSSNTNLDITNLELDSNNASLETNIINVGVCENDQSQNARTHVQLADHEITSSKTEVTAQALQCSGGREENKVDVKENSVIDLDQENKIESEGEGVEPCLETLDKLNFIGENPNSKSIHQEDGSNEAESTVDNIVNLPLTEQAQENQPETAPESGNNKHTDAEIHVSKDHKEDDGLQNIDRENNGDHNIDQSIDVTETNVSKDKTNEQKKTDNTVCAEIINKPFNAGQSESHGAEELENNKFEEISEGSIEQAEQDDLIAESLSDVEITGESFDPLKVQNNRNNVKGKYLVMYKKFQSLGAAYFAAKNNKVNSIAESRDNDDISDDSLSDHIDLSLEEISDDELEPSKKRRKSLGQAPTKTVSDVKTSNSNNNKQDKENTSRSDDMFEQSWKDGANVKAQKHAANDNVGVTHPSSSKRMKLDDKNDIEEVSSSGEQDPTFSADKDVDLKNETERFETKGLDISYNRNVVLSGRNPSQSSTNWRQHNADRSLESRDSVASKRKYEMVDSSCQSEPRVLKGKIVQCNINPVTPNHKLDQKERYDENVIQILELFSKFKHKLPSKIPDTITADVCSLQPSQRTGVYSISMGPLILPDTQSPAFKNILSDTDSFSLVFSDQCHGVFKATFANCGSITSLLAWLSHHGHSMVVSVLYNGEGCVCKAVFLHLGKTSVQAENQIVSEGGGKGVQLYLQGMPSGVSTAFIHLLFPEAQTVVHDKGKSSGTVTLAYSSSKMAEAVLSSYGLLVINGSQINIACVRSLDGNESVNTLAEAINETEVLSKKLPEHGQQFERRDKVSEVVEQVADYSAQKMESKAHVDVTNKFGSSGSQQKPTASNTDEEAGELGKPVSSSTVGSAQNVNKVFPNIESGVSLVCDTDSILTLTDNVEEKGALLQAKGALLQAKGALLQAKDANVERTDLMDKATEIMEVDEVAVQDGELVKLRDETEGEIPFHRAQHLVEVGAVVGKEKYCNLGVAKDADKLEVSVHDKTSDNESHTRKNTAILECGVEMHVQEVDCVIPEGNILDITIDRGGCVASNKRAGEIEAGKEILGDDEVTNEKKHESLDAAIVVGDSLKHVDTNSGFPPPSVVSYGTDNTEEESAGRGRKKSDGRVEESAGRGREKSDGRVEESAGRGREKSDGRVEESAGRGREKSDGRVEESAGRGRKKSDGWVEESAGRGRKKSDGRVEESAGRGREKSDGRVEESAAKAGHSESMNSMLVMTDGALDVVMEVVDVDDSDDQAEKVILPSTRQMSPVFYSSYASKSARQQDRCKKPSTGSNTSVSSKHYYSWSRRRSPSPNELLREPEAHRRDSSPPRRRSRSPSPRRYSREHHHGYKRYDESPPPGRSGNSTRIEFNSRELDKVKTSEYSTHRDPHRSDRRNSYRERRPRSLSRRSESPPSPESAPRRHKSPYRRDSAKHPAMHTSRSPISISSRSHSLSPVSKSSSTDPPPPAVEKDELAKTVEHILKLAKDLNHTKKRQPFRPKSSRRSPSRYSPHFSRSSHTKHSRSPQRALSRSSRSPTYARSSRYKYKRTPSPPSHKGHKRQYGECSSSDRKSEERGTSKYYEREKPKKSGDYSYDDEPSGRSKSGKWPIEPYRSPIDQLGQQSYGGYQSQSCVQVPASNIYSPSFPPPGMYPGSSMPVYHNNSQSQYSYSNVPPGVPPPTYMPNVPPPATPHSFTQPYQPAYPMYPPRF